MTTYRIHKKREITRLANTKISHIRLESEGTTGLKFVLSCDITAVIKRTRKKNCPEQTQCIPFLCENCIKHDNYYLLWVANSEIRFTRPPTWPTLSNHGLSEGPEFCYQQRLSSDSFYVKRHKMFLAGKGKHWYDVNKSHTEGLMAGIIALIGH
jgi:hypothetical protein